jgi:N-formylglutamate deformylase
MGYDLEWRESERPLVAVAVHAGHDLSPAFAAATALTEAERLREEDPYTDVWTSLAPTRVIARQSRFEVDLNRPREEAVYRTGDDAWGGDLWRSPLTDEMVESSLRRHDEFYAMFELVLRSVERQFGAFVVYDLHSYNHRRGGPNAAPDDPDENPEINLGTGSMDRDRWGHIADRFVEELRGQHVAGCPLDVRENVRFKGRQLAAFVHERFPTTGCALAIEVKKTFMDEHTGVLDMARHAEVHRALAATTAGVLQELTHQRVH